MPSSGQKVSRPGPVAAAVWMLATSLAIAACSSTASVHGTVVDSGGATSALGAHGCTNIQGSCNSTHGTLRACSDYAGQDAQVLSAYASECDGPTQTWSTSPCDTSGAVGGCAVVESTSCAVTWSYPPAEASFVQGDCTGPQETFVTPS
jgi:hypothetical protein